MKIFTNNKSITRSTILWKYVVNKNFEFRLITKANTIKFFERLSAYHY